jgi:hypothetical protein
MATPVVPTNKVEADSTGITLSPDTKLTLDDLSVLKVCVCMLTGKCIIPDNFKNLDESYVKLNEHMDTIVDMYFKLHPNPKQRRKEMLAWKFMPKPIKNVTVNFILAQKTHIISQLGLENNTAFLFELASIYIKFVLKCVGIAIGLSLSVVICISVNIPSLIASMGANVFAYVHMSQCLVVACALFLQFAKTAKLEFVNGYSNHIMKYVDYDHRNTAIEFIKNMTDEQEGSANGIDSLAKKAKSKVYSSLQLLEPISFQDELSKLTRDEGHAEVKFKENNLIIMYNNKEIPFHILKDLYNTCLTIQDKLTVLESNLNGYVNQLPKELRLYPTTLIELFDTLVKNVTDDVTMCNSNPLSFLVWKLIKKRTFESGKRSGGGLFTPKVVFIEDIKTMLTAINNADTVSLKSTFFTDDQKKSLLPFLVIFCCPKLLEEIENKANEFLHGDDGDVDKKRMYCEYDKLMLQPAPTSTTISEIENNLQHLSESGSGNTPTSSVGGVGNDTAFNQHDVRHHIYIQIFMRLVYNYALLLDTGINDILTENIKRNAIIEKKTPTQNDQLKAQTYNLIPFLISQGVNAKKYPNEVVNILLEMANYQTYFKDEMQKIIQTFPAEKTQIMEKCFKQPQSKTTGLFSRFKRGGVKLNKAKKAEIKTACDAYHVLRLQQLCEGIKMAKHDTIDNNISCYDALCKLYKTKSNSRSSLKTHK